MSEKREADKVRKIQDEMLSNERTFFGITEDQETMNTMVIPMVKNMLELAQSLHFKYQIKYVDSENWTVPIYINDKRIMGIMDDKSIEKVRLELSFI